MSPDFFVTYLSGRSAQRDAGCLRVQPRFLILYALVVEF
jgi:hypothetical protein